MHAARPSNSNFLWYQKLFHSPPTADAEKLLAAFATFTLNSVLTLAIRAVLAFSLALSLLTFARHQLTP